MKVPNLHRIKLGFVSVILLAVTVAGFSQATTLRAESGQAFSISPPLLELKADPGQTVTAKIKLTNISTDELLMKTQFNDFGAKDEISGDPKIIFDDTNSVSYSLRNWIANPNPFKIASKESKTLEFPISVPKDAEPGGHYAVIRFTGASPELEESGVSLSASVGTLVLLQVSGNVEEKASIVETYPASSPDLAKKGFFEYGPVAFVQRLKNEGNIHLKPTGTVEIFNMFGQKVSSLRVNGDPGDTKNPPRSILPQSIRRFEQTLDHKWMFGRYEARVNLTYGQNKTLSSTSSFWVIPYTLIIIVILLLVGLFFAGRWGLQRYNDHIIEKAQGPRTPTRKL